MVRYLLLLTSALFIGAATLSLQSCGTQSVEAAAPEGPRNGLITLPDGSTMTASRGSLSREIGTWLASREGQTAEFEFAGFAETKPVLTSRGLGRGADLATMLRASPASTIAIAGDKDQANALAHLLRDRGITEERIEVVPAAGIGTLFLTIDRGSTAPLLTAKS